MLDGKKVLKCEGPQQNLCLCASRSFACIRIKDKKRIRLKPPTLQPSRIHPAPSHAPSQPRPFRSHEPHPLALQNTHNKLEMAQKSKITRKIYLARKISTGLLSGVCQWHQRVKDCWNREGFGGFLLEFGLFLEILWWKNYTCRSWQSFLLA